MLSCARKHHALECQRVHAYACVGRRRFGSRSEPAVRWAGVIYSQESFISTMHLMLVKRAISLHPGPLWEPNGSLLITSDSGIFDHLRGVRRGGYTETSVYLHIDGELREYQYLCESCLLLSLSHSGNISEIHAYLMPWTCCSRSFVIHRFHTPRSCSVLTCAYPSLQDQIARALWMRIWICMSVLVSVWGELKQSYK